MLRIRLAGSLQGIVRCLDFNPDISCLRDTALYNTIQDVSRSKEEFKRLATKSKHVFGIFHNAEEQMDPNEYITLVKCKNSKEQKRLMRKILFRSYFS